MDIHTDAYSRYNGVKGVKGLLCYIHLYRAFVATLPKDAYDPKASKPEEAILWLNKLFKLEGELKNLSPDHKKKEHLIRKKQHLEDF